ncbi:class I SAM-dependent rRNA methyltransferase [Ruoffia sp. FAM 20858]|uniref:class I SAM-dependent rRNA methyltransferase n=2 Tax=unclassified Ruoffia TaxID=2862149 RepID=UPI003883DB17
MADYKLRELATKRIKQGGKLIKARDFQNEDKAKHFIEGDVVILNDFDNQFLGKILVGRQNKGVGWLITTYQDEYWNDSLVYYVLEEAFEGREAFFNSTETTAFRVFNGEGDGIGGVTIDWYDHYVQINWYSKGIYEYRHWFFEAIKQLLPEVKGVYETLRFQTDDLEPIQLVSGAEAPDPLVVKENNLNYAVHLGESWMTGIFLDQRDVRDFIKTQANGMSVLNIFSYTGAFSVAASVGGSDHTVSVDVANRSMELTSEQFALNDIEVEDSKHEIRVMDVFNYLDYATKNNITFDLIVSDPPSFARTKKKMFRVEEDYSNLAKQLFKLTNPNGMTILSTNHSGYALEDFRDDMVAATQELNGTYYLIQQFSLPEDFPTSPDEESSYLKVLVFYREN